MLCYERAPIGYRSRFAFRRLLGAARSLTDSQPAAGKHAHAFIGTTLGGHVFVREVHGGSRVGRLPIRELFGPAIPRELLKDDVKATFESTVAAELPIAAERELGALLSGFAPRG